MKLEEITWEEFNKVFANRLLDFKSSREKLVKKIKIVISEEKYVKLGLKGDIDPFTIFGLIYKKIAADNREKLLKNFIEEFELETEGIPTSFDDCPELPTNNALYIQYGSMEEEINKENIDNLWKLFESALDYAEAEKGKKNKQAIINNFNESIKIKNTKVSKITMGLCWIAPNTFININKNILNYLKNPKKFPSHFSKDIAKKIESGSEYFQIIEVINKYLESGEATVSTIKEFSTKVWKESKGKENKNNNENDISKSENTDKKQEIAEYNSENFLEEVFMAKEKSEQLFKILKHKKNIILQGAPGVGKTYAAKRIAYAFIGKKDDARLKIVQFHQSYSYEDFIMGFRPDTEGGGFQLKKGIFYNFCEKARNDINNDYFFIIDEINRGNLSKIFGELLMLIEKDKRGEPVQLVYSDEEFSVPENLYIIGMMNTADRSIAMLDYALRRRFSFIGLTPGFDTDQFKKNNENKRISKKYNSLINKIKDLNYEISKDETLGDGFCIGHSYFCNLQIENDDESILSNIVEFEIIPLLKEYWFDNPEKAERWSKNLRGEVK